MKAILREGIRENMTQNIRLYPELYPVQTTMDGCSPTEDACSYIAKYIECEYQNLGELEKCDFEEFKDLCIETAFSELELCDSSNEETGETRDYLFEEVNRYLEKETIEPLKLKKNRPLKQTRNGRKKTEKR